MSQLVIKDLDFYQARILQDTQLHGGVYMPNLWDWKVKFDFNFDHDGVSNFAYGHASLYAIAIGPIIINNINV